MANQNTINEDVADAFDEVAHLLETQGANPFRIRSYRRAARELRALDESVEDIVRERGTGGLREIAGIGESLAAAIDEYVKRGQLRLLDRLRRDVPPTAIFEQLPGIGPELSERIYEELEIGTLEELERAAHDGRLEEIDRIGPKKAAGMRDALAGKLGRSSRRRARARSSSRKPPVDLVLGLDRYYRKMAETDELRRIAPRRFNPEGERWLPILETNAQGWSFTVLFSNTARAHELEKTHDWVVIYYERGQTDGHSTVVTAPSGPLEGRRVIRGREAECRRYYEKRDAG